MQNYSNCAVPSPKIKLVEKAEPRCEAFSPATVVIGDQTWMKENLAVDDGGEGIYFNEKNGEHYYTWDAAMRIAKNIPGWHLPEDDEWVEAAKECEATPDSDGDYDDAAKLKSKLNIKLVGLWFNDSFCYEGIYVSFWTASENSSSNAYNRNFNTGTSMNSYHDDKIDNAYAVRLVKD